ncbi:cytochrome P450 [Xylariales sp. PMI_506]|nr:cytochrome P450 [Xylariales sp. PMI_506]
MLSELITVLVLLASGVAYFIFDVIRKRNKLNGLPQPPMPNKLMGHLHIADECARLFPKGAHPHQWPFYIKEKYNLPETFYVDWRPFGPLWMFSSDPELASRYATTTQSLPKSPYETSFLNHFLGEANIVSLEGHSWKQVRSMFNPGFSATNVMTMADYIVDACLEFKNVWRELASKGDLIELDEYTTRLTIDIIGKATLDVDMKAQRQLHPIVKYFRERVTLMPPGDAVLPWQGVDVFRPWKLWRNGIKLNGAINEELNQKIVRRAKELEDEERGAGCSAPKKSIIDLALKGYEKDMSMSAEDQKNPTRILRPADLSPSLRDSLVTQIKAFFFAGHDTTSSTICWCYYLLHRNPEVQAKLKAELDSFFPPGTDSAAAIRKDPYIVNKLEYTIAVIKETLRIFPPASTLRHINDKTVTPEMVTTIVDPRTGQQLPIVDAHIWPAAHFVHRNSRFFPEPTKFVPERFIPSQTPYPDSELFTAAGKDAWRPFEKGPRNCVGQELAMLETKIIIALTAREFDFVLEYPGEEADLQWPIPDTTAEELSEMTAYGKGIRNGTIKPVIVEGHRIWSWLAGSAKPNGGCPGRVYVREGY